MNYRYGRPKGTMRNTRERGDPRKFRGLGLKCYLRRGHGQTLSSGVISAWADFSATTADWTQATAGSRPAPSDGGADFDGTDDWLLGPALNTLITVSAYTLFAVVSVDAVDTNNAATYQNDGIIGDGNGTFFGLHLKSAPTAHAYNWDGSDDHADVAISAAATMVVTSRHGSGSMGIRINEGSEATAASGDTSVISNNTNLGRGAGNNTYCLDGKVYGLVVFNTHLADDVQRRIRSALACDAGVSL